GLVGRVRHDRALAHLAPVHALLLGHLARPLGAFGGLGGRDLLFPQDRVDAGDVLAYLIQAGVVVELAGDVLEAQVEQLLPRLGQPPLELVVVDLPQLGRLHLHHHLVTADHELGLDGELLDGAFHGLARERLGHAGQLEHDPAGLHHRHPALRVALPRTHTGLGRLLGDRLVGEDVDPDLSAALHVTGHRDTCGLDLAGGDPARLERLDAVVAEHDAHAARGDTRHPPALLLAVLYLPGHQHERLARYSSGRKWGVS